MEEKSLHRDWVKNAAIIFLSVLLVLTFFSNTIMNRTLPEAAAKQVVNGSIVAQVRVSGTVSADGSYEVKADRSREIRSVMVRTGDKVETGDVLFVLGEGDSEELEAAQDNLRALQLSYQRAAIGMQNYDYTREEAAIKAAQEEYDAADQNYKIAEENYKNGNIPGINDEAIANIESQLEQLYEARNEREKIVQGKITESENKIQAALDSYNKAVNDYNNYLNNEEAKTQADYNEQLQNLKNIRDAKFTEYSNAKVIHDDLISKDDPELASIEQEILRLETDRANLESSGGALGAALSAARAARAEAEQKLLDLKYDLDQKKAQDGKAQALAGLELSELAQQIEKAKAKVSELSGGEENEVKANVSGTVQSIAITAGSMATKGTVLCVIEVPDLGYSLTATVTAEQARRLHIGDTATIQNYYWGSQIVATLKTIQNDPKNPQNSRILTFALDGDVTAGSELKLSVGSRSANYDTILPNSAIRTDSNGTFVLVIQEKSSPLGNRYIAVRQPVEVLASDDQNTAVTGGVNSGDFVITTTDRPVEPGDQVRMAD